MFKRPDCFKTTVVLLLTLLLMVGLCSCNKNNSETITIYPCYFNQDVEGVDASTICATLEQAEYELAGTRIEDNYTVYIYLAKEHTNEHKKGFNIVEYSSNTEAEQAYIQESRFNSSILMSDFVLENQYFTTLLRISNCVITARGNAHTELYDLLGFDAIQPLEANLNMTYEICKGCDSVDIETVRKAMEEDGYQFYATEFLMDDEDDGFTQSYIIVSPEQNRIYAYTGRGKQPVLGVPFAYSILDSYYEPFLGSVGFHVVGFKDGSNVLCYGDSFEEIRAYFVQ